MLSYVIVELYSSRAAVATINSSCFDVHTFRSTDVFEVKRHDMLQRTLLAQHEEHKNNNNKENRQNNAQTQKVNSSGVHVKSDMR